MEGLEQERRGIFGGVKPPFDLNGVFLAFLAILLFYCGVWVIGQGLGEPAILPRIIRSVNLPYVHDLNRHVISDARWEEVQQELAAINDKRPDDEQLPLLRLAPFAYILTGFWALVLWAFFGGAIGRIMAMKIARDEGMELLGAVKFGFQKFLSNFMSVFTIAVAIFLLYFFCNTIVAGYLSWIPWIGEILLLAMYPFIFLSCLIIMLLLIPLAFGFTLMSSAISTESSDSFDGMSRAFSYVYSRPWQVIQMHILTFIYMGIFFLGASLFLDISIGSLRTNELGMSAAKARIYTDFIDGRSNFSGVRIDRELFEMTKDTPSIVDRDKDPELERKFAADPELAAQLTRTAVPFLLRLSGQIVWVFFFVAKLFVFSCLVAYWFSASQAMYFILRRDVDGEDPSEIYIEEEREEEPFEITTPDEPVAADAPPMAVTSAETETTPTPPPEKPKSARKSTKRKTSGTSARKKSSRRSSTSGGGSQRGKKSGRGKSS